MASAGRQIFGEALAQCTMTGFFKLVEQYSTQDEPAFCWLASLAMVSGVLCTNTHRTALHISSSVES